MTDCGDVAADWLRSVVAIDNARLVRHDATSSSCLRSEQSTADDAQLISETQPATRHGLLHGSIVV